MPSHRNRAWADQRFAGNSLVAGTGVLVDLLSDAPTVDTLTAVRLVGDVTCQYVVSTTVADSMSIVDVGIGVGSVEAFAAGINSLPNPDVTTEYPPRGWLYVASLPVVQILTTDSGIVDQPARFQFDLRAMRKIDKGRLFMMLLNTNLVQGGAMQVVGRVRTLCLT